MLRRYVLVLMLGGTLIGCSAPSDDVGPAAQNTAGRETDTDETVVSKTDSSESQALDATTVASASPQVSADPPGPPTKDASSRLADKSFDDIKFEMEVGDPFDRKLLTSEIEALHGRRIRIRGYILPTATKRGIKEFVLVRDNLECCFGPGAALYDCILVEMEEDKSAEFSIRPVAVTGVFTVQEFAPYGDTLAIYHLLADSVE